MPSAVETASATIGVDRGLGRNSATAGAALHRRANDARSGEAVVQTATVAADDGGDETETGGHGEQHPHERAEKRAAQVERHLGVGGDHADAGDHLPERLASGGEGDEIAAVLHEEKRDE